MKIDFRILLSLAFSIFHFQLYTLHASVPLRWTVETSRAQSAQFEAFRGETVDLEATMQNYGMPLEVPVQPSLYWQTNGMCAAWWTAPASCSGNVVRASFTPTNDCGANVYNCFIGGTGSTYRAAFRLRMLPSPGFTPNVLPLPSVTYDAALFGNPTINGTNLTEWVAAAGKEELSEWVRTNNFSSTGGSVAGVDTNAVNALIASATNAITAASIGAVAQTFDETEHKTLVKIGDEAHDGYLEVKGGSLSVGITSIKTDGIDVGTDTSGEINIGHYQGVINLGDGDGKIVINGGFGEGEAYINIGGAYAATLADATNIVDSAIAAAPTTYTNLTGSAYVALNQSVQTITVNGTAITIGAMPPPVPGGTRDFVIYINNTSASTDAPLSLPAGTYYGDDGSTNAFAKGTISALYLTEMNNGVFMIGRRELKQIVIQ